MAYCYADEHGPDITFDVLAFHAPTMKRTLNDMNAATGASLAIVWINQVTTFNKKKLESFTRIA